MDPINRFFFRLFVIHLPFEIHHQQLDVVDHLGVINQLTVVLHLFVIHVPGDVQLYDVAHVAHFYLAKHLQLVLLLRSPASLMLLFSVLVLTTLLLLVDHFRHLHHLNVVDNLDVVDRDVKNANPLRLKTFNNH